MKKLTVLLFSLMLLLMLGCTDTVSCDGNVIIALLDTGASTTAIKSENLLDGWNYVQDSSDTEDRINHGTAVASVISGCESAGVVGVATDARIVPLVVADKVDGEQISISPTELAGVVRDSVDKYGAHIINVSLGTKNDTPELREAIEYVQKKGALVIAAAGNSGECDELYYPAAYEGVLTVGSHDKNFEISDFTQQSESLDILAPGEDIWLASRKGKTYGARGTSYATGYVSAYAAVIWSDSPTLSADEVKSRILSDADTVNGWKILK